jgi:Cyclin D1 binding domain
MSRTIQQKGTRSRSRDYAQLLILGILCGLNRCAAALRPSFLPSASQLRMEPLRLFKGRSEGGQKGSHQSHGEERRRLEFFDLEPTEIPPLRQERLHRDETIRSKFVRGNDLWDLRAQMDEMASKLVKAIKAGKNGEEDVIRHALRSFEQRDPELVYMLELTDMEEATLDGRVTDAKSHRQKAIAARSCLPQFNLDGLWVGKYGSHGYELINVTYVGDTLVATKVTGDKNVPRGEVSFVPDLYAFQWNEGSTSIMPLTRCMLSRSRIQKSISEGHLPSRLAPTSSKCPDRA